jgi:hypothetical protein
VSKFTNDERSQIQNIVANLTIKRIPDPMIIKHIFNQTGKSISRKTLWNIRQRLKKESYHWYSKLREGEYEYLHEFKERINEIVGLQKKAHKIFDDNIDNPDIQLDSIAELHKLNITLSNYFDVAPSIGNISISETQTTTRERETKRNISDKDIIV